MVFLMAVLVAVSAFVFWNSVRSKGASWHPVNRTLSMVALGVGFIASLVAFSRAVVVVPAGHVGVVDFFGNVSKAPRHAGINLVNPLANVHVFSIKTQEIKEDMAVPSKEGLAIQLEVSVLFHLNPEKAPEVYRTVGPNYVAILLEPQFRSTARAVTAGVEAKALYTSDRERLTTQLHDEITKAVRDRGIVIETTPLRKVVLPAGLTAAIEEKLRAEQESQRMEFVLLKEKQEADRKRIEAKGIADFQDIVAKGISEPLLRWKGIEATEKLATSQNSKIVVIGSGKDGLPLILNAE